MKSNVGEQGRIRSEGAPPPEQISCEGNRALHLSFKHRCRSKVPTAYCSSESTKARCLQCARAAMQCGDNCVNGSRFCLVSIPICARLNQIAEHTQSLADDTFPF